MKMLSFRIPTGMLSIALLASSPAIATTPGSSTDFHPYVLKAVTRIAAERANGGYKLSKAFTQDLSYGSDCCVGATKPLEKIPGPNATMCVAAVAEVIVEALNLYGEATGDWGFKTQLPMSSWTRGNTTSIRANIFMFKGSGSRGTAHTLQRFGMGREKLFSELQAGDFVNLNRQKTGHAVVFLGYIDSDKQEVSKTFSPKTVGFRYFSAQGPNRVDGGFGYRNAYFDKSCPSPRGKDDDCGVIRAFRVGADGKGIQKQALLNTGEIMSPPLWKVSEAMAILKSQVTRSVQADTGLTRGAQLDAAVEAELNRELVPNEALYADGTE